MIEYSTRKRLIHKTIDKDSRFVLIGNKIDGFVDVGIVEFKNFNEVKSVLPQIIKTIEFGGEWDLKLYEIPKVLKIKKLYGYYKVPFNGKLVFTLDYMCMDQNIDFFINDALINVYTYSNPYASTPYGDGESILNTINEEYITVLLFHKCKKAKFVDEVYVDENLNLYNLIHS